MPVAPLVAAKMSPDVSQSGRQMASGENYWSGTTDLSLDSCLSFLPEEVSAHRETSTCGQTTSNNNDDDNHKHGDHVSGACSGLLTTPRTSYVFSHAYYLCFPDGGTEAQRD